MMHGPFPWFPWTEKPGSHNNLLGVEIAQWWPLRHTRIRVLSRDLRDDQFGSNLQSKAYNVIQSHKKCLQKADPPKNPIYEKENRNLYLCSITEPIVYVDYTTQCTTHVSAGQWARLHCKPNVNCIWNNEISSPLHWLVYLMSLRARWLNGMSHFHIDWLDCTTFHFNITAQLLTMTYTLSGITFTRRIRGWTQCSKG